jgi:hypothetical protein
MGSRRAASASIAAFARAAVLLVALGGCGGGVYIGGGFGDDDDPEITLTAQPETVSPGQVVRLQAEAFDDFAVFRVSFYSVRSGTRTLLGRDTVAPFEFDVQVAADATGTLQFVARAEDFSDNTEQSNTVSVTVVP